MDSSENAILTTRRDFCGLVALTLLSSGLASGIAASATGVKGTSLNATILDRSGQPVEHAVLSLHTGVSSQAPPSTVATMDQRQLQFAPEVIAIQTGTTVSFPNHDDVRHHVYSFSHPNAFELKLYHGEAGKHHRFERPGVVVLGCNIHDGMIGYMRVVDTPHFAKSNADGALTIENAVSGRQKLKLWHPDLGMHLIEKSIETVTGPNSIELTLDIENSASAAKPKSEHKLQSLFRN